MAQEKIPIPMNGVTRWIAIVRDVGFPIAITAYLLYRMDTLLVNLTLEIKRMSGLMENVLRFYEKIQ